MALRVMVCCPEVAVKVVMLILSRSLREDVDGCMGNNCHADATCSDVAAPGIGFTCACTMGYEGNGTFCMGMGINGRILD